MIRDGRLDVSRFVSHRLGLEDVNDAVSRMRSGEIVHAMIHFPLFTA
jgi:Zn-dependent alcohol dehydrogenase